MPLLSLVAAIVVVVWRSSKLSLVDRNWEQEKFEMVVCSAVGRKFVDHV
jgi:hypothetical protein